MSKSTIFAFIRKHWIAIACGTIIGVISEWLGIPFWMMILTSLIVGMMIGISNHVLSKYTQTPRGSEQDIYIPMEPKASQTVVMQVQDMGKAKPSIFIDDEDYE